MTLLLQSDAAKIKGFNEDLADETAVALQTENGGLHPGLSASKNRPHGSAKGCSPLQR